MRINLVKIKLSAGMVLGLAALLAIILKNSQAYNLYDLIISFSLPIKIDGFFIHTSLLFWVNDFLMAIFFLLVGLELKRESLEGQLSIKANRNLPMIAAMGGMVCPVLIYLYLNWGHATQGFAIPAATDITFALGILSLLKSRIPHSLRLCLLSLAIFDDIAAILIIAIFYTTDFSITWLLVSLVPLFILAALNKCAVKTLTSYLIVGFVLWACIFKSGIHPTIAGILLASFIPCKTNGLHYSSPLKKIEHVLHPWVSFVILPIFAFFNSGISLHGLSFPVLTQPIVLGIAAGLFLGKQFGVMLFSFIGIKLNWCRLPKEVTWPQYYGLAVITGIGFTMSLFIGMLAFSTADAQTFMRFGVMLGSLFSGAVGYIVLAYAMTKKSSIV